MEAPEHLDQRYSAEGHSIVVRVTRELAMAMLETDKLNADEFEDLLTNSRDEIWEMAQRKVRHGEMLSGTIVLRREDLIE